MATPVGDSAAASRVRVVEETAPLVLARLPWPRPCLGEAAGAGEDGRGVSMERMWGQGSEGRRMDREPRASRWKEIEVVDEACGGDSTSFLHASLVTRRRKGRVGWMTRHPTRPA